MFASAARFSAALARQPAAAVAASTATAAGLKTSAVASIAATKTLRDTDGRLYSLSRRQIVYDSSAPWPPVKEANWANVAARIRDAKDLAGC